tara:strand:- start:413 stop:637 length:225 start_codon:yes stop_codon:yes gene_type:complete
MQQREMVNYGFIACGMLLTVFSVFQVTGAINKRSAAIVNVARINQYGACLRAKKPVLSSKDKIKYCKDAIFHFR